VRRLLVPVTVYAPPTSLLESSIELWQPKLILTHHRTLFVNKAGLEHAKNLVAGYKQGKIGEMNAELWSAKKVVDSTLHPGLLYLRMRIELC